MQVDGHALHRQAVTRLVHSVFDAAITEAKRVVERIGAGAGIHHVSAAVWIDDVVGGRAGDGIVGVTDADIFNAAQRVGAAIAILHNARD